MSLKFKFIQITRVRKQIRFLDVSEVWKVLEILLSVS
jgi:hypothetical protein